MKDKIYEFVMLIIYWVLYGVAIGIVICTGFQNDLQIVLFVLVSAQVLLRTFSAIVVLLDTGE